MKERYEVPTYRIPELEERIKKLNRKAAKLDCEPITITITDERVMNQRTIEYHEKGAPFDTDTVDHFAVECAVVVLEGETPMLNGWLVMSAIEYIDSKPVFHKIEEDELPARMRTQGAICEHCGTNRRRRYLYALKNAETDEWMQVGSTCLRDFTGANDPHAVTSYLAYLHEFVLLCQFDDPIPDGERWINIEHFLTYACAAVREDNGFIGRRRARETNGYATADRAWDTINGQLNTDTTRPLRVETTEEDEEKAIAALEWARALSKRDDLNDFEHNLLTLAEAGLTDFHNAGIAAAMVFAYDREKTNESEATPGHIGTVGERGEFELTVQHVIPNVGFYDATLFKLADAAGHQAVWFSSNGTRMEAGRTYIVKATVKAHGNYKGTDQTTLSRCKVVSAAEQWEDAKAVAA